MGAVRWSITFWFPKFFSITVELVKLNFKLQQKNDFSLNEQKTQILTSCIFVLKSTRDVSKRWNQNVLKRSNEFWGYKNL